MQLRRANTDKRRSDPVGSPLHRNGERLGEGLFHESCAKQSEGSLGDTMRSFAALHLLRMTRHLSASESLLR
jgi:hypothetical protein